MAQIVTEVNKLSHSTDAPVSVLEHFEATLYTGKAFCQAGPANGKETRGNRRLSERANERTYTSTNMTTIDGTKDETGCTITDQ